METILKVESIVKEFSKVLAVNRLSFSINEGEIFALLGPNGAGKTTTVRMLMGIIKPDSGRIEFSFGNKIYEKAEPGQIGYLPEERGLYLDIPIIKTLEFMGVIRGMDKTSARKSGVEWLEKLDLFDRKDEKLSTLSKGNQQKVQFIASVLHNPEFVVLDEPFSGFDPINQELFIGIIKELKNSGMTILLSAHQMQLVEKIADNIVMMNKGKMISEGSVEDIMLKVQNKSKIILTVKDLFSYEELLSANTGIEIDENQITIIPKHEESLSEVLKNLSDKLDIQSIRTEQKSLHDAFIELIEMDKED